jgi:glycerol-3-phosphate dehydrogenase subunit B
METEILIIGAGIAGISAFYKIKEKGRDVKIVGRTGGATFLSSGAFDFPERKLENFHPFSIISKNFSNHSEFFKFLENSTFEFFEYLKKYGLDIDGSFGKKLLLVNSLGTYKYSNFALKTIKDGDLNFLKDEKLIFLGILNFSEFNSEFLKNSVSYLSSLGIFPSLKKISHLDIDFGYSIYLNPFYIAEKIEKEPEKFIDCLKRNLKGEDFTAIGFPAVLGIEKSGEIKENIEKNLGVKFFEILPALPSVCGLRIKKAFEKISTDKKIEGKVLRANIRDRKITSVVVENKKGKFEIKAKLYILATGKFIGGGIKFEKVARESIFNLPLFYEDENLKNKNIFSLTDEKITSSQKIFSIGLRTNEKFQPVNENGEIIYENLFACGSILSGYDYLREKSGMGTALISGIFVGEEVNKYV